MKKKYLKMILLVMLLLIPTFVYAESFDEDFPILLALGVEAFVTIHMTVFVLLPLSKILSKDSNNSKPLFWKLFIGRICILLFFDFFVTKAIVLVDFMMVFVGAILVGIIATFKKKDPETGKPKLDVKETAQQLVDNSKTPEQVPIDKNKVLVNYANYDLIYSYDENSMVEEFIKRELKKAEIDEKSSLIPSDILKRKRTLNIIFSFLLFVYITLIFFHFPIYTYVIGLVILLIFYKVTNNYNLIKYLKKEIKARPSEKISNIVMNVKTTSSVDNTKSLKYIMIIIAIVLPLIIFSSPRIMYEKVDGGYAVRYYAFGLSNYTTATIPKEYNGEPVVSLRGNAFSNMPFLKKVSLPDTITEIRGQAFKNDIMLESVNIPEVLEYLGGGSFYNAKKIKSISLPDTLTYLGGESFYGATSLESIKLSNNLTEIRGNTFENCSSLKSITIPDKVTRIGGHAFYGATSLESVILTEKSKLNEIGSSAFRRCYALTTITIPSSTYVNERAFKESPTTVNYFDNTLLLKNSYNTPSENRRTERIINDNNTWMKNGEKVTFSEGNISVTLKSYTPSQKKGLFIIDFNDDINKDIQFYFSYTDEAISYHYLDYHFRIVRLDSSQVALSVTKSVDYSKNYSKNASYSFSKGDSYVLPKSNYTIKLEEVKITGYRTDYVFSCNGKLFDKAVGNSYFFTLDYDKNIKIQIRSYYGTRGIYLRIYYN